MDKDNNEFFEYKKPFKFNKLCMAFKDDCNILSKLEKNQLPSDVMLLDGFNQKFIQNILPEGLESLYLGDIKQELVIGSILYTVKNVYLFDGFNQKLIPAVLPKGVKSLFIGDIKQKLIIGSIPNTVRSVYLEDGFNQKLAPAILPEGVESLDLGDIKQELINGSIPKTVTKVVVSKKFKYQIKPYVSNKVQTTGKIKIHWEKFY
ncbi:hypothetical protein DDB_G0290861 [Dictyostelium discoideum AX4]|uniref:FNIP repeat-containing protein n=1 Tax=Dictyostelium discoideum TaxID=44689 RepID=Q54FH1_DICDI|nr:hypothetical protein DDB_G0290861 [Dictyostelium discoideum AX4]EAL61995.1 hypothetical protein DDB_G0290861 [Dictyostelium discoideum AX4]|eukprot:XP_635500.1 hypothetical protein DDB_G0290861 [Dictyostelium discoideum AX4]